MSRLDKDSNEGRTTESLVSLRWREPVRRAVSPSHVRVPKVSIGHPPAPAKEPDRRALVAVDPKRIRCLREPSYGAAYLFDLSCEVKELGSPMRPLPWDGSAVLP